MSTSFDVSGQHVGKPLFLIATFAVLSLAYFVGIVVHRLFFDPLSRIPGPKINALSRWPYIRHLVAGTTAQNVMDLHKKYGDVVRTSPNEVSFISGETAWPQIYGFRTGEMKGHLTMPKDPVWYPKPLNGAKSILIAGDEDHSRGRRIIAHAFSEKALSEQEPLIQRYVDQLVDGLKEVTSKSPQPQDMTTWYNWFTFDVIIDLTFGKPLGCLQHRSTHQYIELLLKNLEGFGLQYILTYWPWVKYTGNLIVNNVRGKQAKRVEFLEWIKTQTGERISREVERPDIMGYILKHNGEKGLNLSRDEMDSNASLFLVAGSETTATLLSGTTHALVANPEKLKKLQQEVRGRFKSYHDITLAEVNNSPYLLAVLNESLRYMPPVPTGFQRQLNKGGDFVSGYYLPEGTGVCISHYPAYRSETNFKDANSFIPERWMGDPQYDGDKKSILQPFSFGPRNCVGKNLAYAEMRLALAKLVWTFDMELDSSTQNWLDRCRVMTVWKKPPLNIKVTEVVRS